MTVSITNVARGVRLARDSGVPLSDILENRNFTTLDMKDRAAVVKEYASSHEVEARPMDTKQRIKALAAKAAWGALSGAAAGLPVAMVIRSGFMPLSKSPKALLTGLRMAAADKSVQLGVGLMAGMGGAQGAYNAVKKIQAQESDKQRVHNALEAIRKGGDDADAHAYGAMFGSVRHYDDPKPVTFANPIINTVGQLVKPYEKAINSVNYGRLLHEADELGVDGMQERMEHDLGIIERVSGALEAARDDDGNPYPREMIDHAIRGNYNPNRTATDEDIANADKAVEIANKAKMLKGMMDQVNGASILSEPHQDLAEHAQKLSKSDTLGDIANYLKHYRDSQ